MLLSPDLKFKLTARGEMEKYKVRVLFTNKCRVNNAIVFFFACLSRPYFYLQKTIAKVLSVACYCQPVEFLESSQTPKKPFESKQCDMPPIICNQGKNATFFLFLFKESDRLGMVVELRVQKKQKFLGGYILRNCFYIIQIMTIKNVTKILQ